MVVIGVGEFGLLLALDLDDAAAGSVADALAVPLAVLAFPTDRLARARRASCSPPR
jgi:hypothetical protein